MLQFTINEETCINCGECVTECPYGILLMDDEDLPAVDTKKEDQCIECQHCFAVCPTGALSIVGLEPEQSRPLKGNLPDPRMVETLMLGRRSTRRYKKEPVDPGLIDQIMDVVRNAPTGVNSRQTRFTLVEDPVVMDALRERTYEGVRAALDGGTVPPGLEFFGGIIGAWDKGVDIIYRGAPHFLVVSAPKDGPSPMADCLIALSYFELLANAHGLGTVWDGLAKWALLAIAPEVSSMLSIPEGHEVGYMMAFGNPAVTFHRTVQRPGGTLKRVTL